MSLPSSNTFWKRHPLVWSRYGWHNRRALFDSGKIFWIHQLTLLYLTKPNGTLLLCLPYPELKADVYTDEEAVGGGNGWGTRKGRARGEEKTAECRQTAVWSTNRGLIEKPRSDRQTAIWSTNRGLIDSATAPTWTAAKRNPYPPWPLEPLYAN